MKKIKRRNKHKLPSVAACHKDVVKVVEMAVKHNVVIIPFGGELFGVCVGVHFVHF